MDVKLKHVVLINYLIVFCACTFAQKTDTLPSKPKYYYGKTGFIDQKAIFLKVKNDSAFVYVFNGQVNSALKVFYDTLIIPEASERVEAEKCNLLINGNQYSLEFMPKTKLKQIKLKPISKVELYTYLNESWINEQREVFFNASNQNVKSYALYDKTVVDSGILDLIEKDPQVFIKAFESAFENVKFVDPDEE